MPASRLSITRGTSACATAWSSRAGVSSNETTGGRPASTARFRPIVTHGSDSTRSYAPRARLATSAPVRAESAAERAIHGHEVEGWAPPVRPGTPAALLLGQSWQPLGEAPRVGGPELLLGRAHHATPGFCVGDVKGRQQRQLVEIAQAPVEVVDEPDRRLAPDARGGRHDPGRDRPQDPDRVLARARGRG